MHVANTEPQPQCALLSKLPAELRCHIWELLLLHDAATATPALPTHLFPGAPPSARTRDRFCANVLRTCRQIHQEGTPVLYGGNTFTAHRSLLATLPSFTLVTRPNRVSLPPVTHRTVAQHIKRFWVHVRLDVDPRFTRRQVEESFTGVERLEVEVFQAMFASSDFTVLKLFEGVRGVGKAKVQGSIGDGRYAEWLAWCMEQQPGCEVEPYSEEFVGGDKARDAWVKGYRV